MRISRPAVFVACLLFAVQSARAHLLVDNAMDVVVGRDAVSVEVRISLDEISVVEAHGKSDFPLEQWQALIAAHRAYVLKHIHFRADNIIDLTASPLPAGAPPGEMIETSNSTEMALYKFEYPLESAPALVQIYQDDLIEYDQSDASYTLRMRQNDQSEFATSQLHRDGHADFNCNWKAGGGATTQATSSRVEFWPNAKAFFVQGVWHILTGYDHLLFVSGLVLAAVSFWDLVKVVAAFTLAHTLTLTLCVFNIVNLSSRIVEPMISTSIMLVALQNIFFPKQSTGWARMAIAFGFGLFHGLGFAGGLKDAMSELPAMALWVSLIAFSIGVETGHQIVVIPFFMILRLIRKLQNNNRQPTTVFALCRLYGSWAICIAGGYFLVQALRIGD